MNVIEKDKTYIAGTYHRFPVVITHGKGSLVYDENGKEYVDMGSGIGVTAFGISDDAWVAAVTDQLNKVQHTSNLYYTGPGAALAEQLCLRTGMKKVFFSNSGAEANECAVKAVRKYAAETKGPDCHTVVTLKNSFHGRTLTTLAATGQETFHRLYQPLTPGFLSVEAGDLYELEAVVAKHNVAAVMIEMIQGEGGVLPLDPGYVAELNEFLKKHDILLIVDEVQTGNGRTGKLYAYMHYGLTPDVVTTAKGLAGGLPLGATLLGEKLRDVFGYGDNGSTFGGNPAAAAGALSVLSRIDDALLSEVAAKGEWLKAAFSGKPGIRSVTGLGLMLGLETEKPAAEVVKAAMANGVLCLTAKNKVRLLPALNIPTPLLERAADVIVSACKP